LVIKRRTFLSKR